MTILGFNLLPSCEWNRMPPLFWGSLIQTWNFYQNSYIKISESNWSWENISLEPWRRCSYNIGLTNYSATGPSLVLKWGSPSHPFFPLTEPLFPMRNLFHVDSSGLKIEMSKLVLGLYDWFRRQHVTQTEKIGILTETFLLLRRMLPFPLGLQALGHINLKHINLVLVLPTMRRKLAWL